VKEYGRAAATGVLSADTLETDKTYIVTSLDQAGNGAIVNTEDDYFVAGHSAADIKADTSAVYRGNNSDGVVLAAGTIAVGDVLVMNATAVAGDIDTDLSFKEVLANDNAFIAGDEYEIVSLGTNDSDNDGAVTINTATYDDAGAIGRATNLANGAVLKVGTKFTVDSDASVAELAHLNALTGGMTFRKSSDTLTKDIEAIQALINTARVQAGSQYAAMESAVNYTTDLTAQYELGYNTVNDVNFSMETAHLAKNQILQQAATAMLAQANSGQQGLLQLIS